MILFQEDIYELIKKIKKHFKWKGMKNYVKNYLSYQKNKITIKKIKQSMGITSQVLDLLKKSFQIQ